ncbi:unnamed protein product [Parascedosporium putredinis]|uniref:Catechol dioxygenase N-terminal domain-containing protein n=1 Tax=Parascedosporium putredinis TaxID=1442378 RepID=A0A9P1H8I0_9PEZI|nr:unnamed protein product [Parascedosporium putredinis]CAI8000805.1 unnamed protein product [Parascedosporium putredinis]
MGLICQLGDVDQQTPTQRDVGRAVGAARGFVIVALLGLAPTLRKASDEMPRRWELLISTLVESHLTVAAVWAPLIPINFDFFANTLTQVVQLTTLDKIIFTSPRNENGREPRERKTYTDMPSQVTQGLAQMGAQVSPAKKAMKPPPVPDHGYDLNFTDQVIAATGPNAHKRMAEVMPSLLRHLHDFAREVDLTVAEWMAAVEFINAAGQMSNDRRNETQLVCDILGLESLVDEISSKLLEKASLT